MPTLDFVIKLCLAVPKLTLAGLIILSAAQGAVHFSLSGQNYSSIKAFNLQDIDNDKDTLFCFTMFKNCCRKNETGTNNALGSWKFPNGKTVESKSNSSSSIVRTRGLSSVILHRVKNESSPTGVYTCEIPDGAGTMIKLFAHLYVNTTPDVKVSICLNERNGLYCTVRGGLVAAYGWIVNGSQYCHGLSDKMKIINYTTVTSQLFYNGNSTKLVGTFQCTIEDGMGRNLSSESLEINEATTQANIVEDSCRVDNTPSSSPSITIIIAVVVSIIVIIVTSHLIIFILVCRNLCFNKEEKLLAIQNKNSKLSTDTIAFDTSSFNEEQSKNDNIPVYSVVNKHSKKTNEQKTCKGGEDDKIAVCYSTVCRKEEPSSNSEVSDLYARVDKSAGKMKTLPEDKMAQKYSTVCSKKESDDKKEVQNVSDLYAAVTKGAKKFPEDMALLYATVDKTKK